MKNLTDFIKENAMAKESYSTCTYMLTKAIQGLFISREYHRSQFALCRPQVIPQD